MNTLPTTVAASDLEGARWFKSSYSSPGAECVETALWFKSSYSNAGGECVEAADLTGTANDAVAVRDSKAPNGPALLLGREPFTAFIAGVRAGRFDTV